MQINSGQLAKGELWSALASFGRLPAAVGRLWSALVSSGQLSILLTKSIKEGVSLTFYFVTRDT